eukprot:392658-Prymnesium_polylepis.1
MPTAHVWRPCLAVDFHRRQSHGKKRPKCDPGKAQVRKKKQKMMDGKAAQLAEEDGVGGDDARVQEIKQQLSWDENLEKLGMEVNALHAAAA